MYELFEKRSKHFRTSFNFDELKGAAPDVDIYADNKAVQTNIPYNFTQVIVNTLYHYILDVDNYSYSIIKDIKKNFNFLKFQKVQFVFPAPINTTFKNFIWKCVKNNPKINLNWVDTSSVTDMSYVFSDSFFNGNINGWNVSNVTNMSAMFYNSVFNKPLNKWDVSKVQNMSNMFCNAGFNQDINSWDVSNVTDMNSMFMHSCFNKPLNKWNTSSVTNMSKMFSMSAFNQGINTWDTSNVTDINSMFAYSKFNKPLDKWDASNFKACSNMFATCPFNQDISMWNINPCYIKSMLNDSDIDEKYKPISLTK